MKSSIIAGLIAGFGLGIVMTFLRLNGLWKLFSVNPFVFPVSNQHIALITITFGIVWGIIFGVFYAFFYNYIPAKGVKKGLVYGLIIWVMAILRNTVVSAVYGYYLYSIPETLDGFFSITIAYGLLIGILYKKK